MLIAAAQLQHLLAATAAIGAGVVVLAYIFLIAVPAWQSYGRAWEKASALFLSLYVLIVMAGVGALVGFGFFWIVGRSV